VDHWILVQLHQRDGALLLFLLFLLGAWLWIDRAYEELKRFLRERPEAKRSYDEWHEADAYKRQRLCPIHKMYVPPRLGCPICGWKP